MGFRKDELFINYILRLHVKRLLSREGGIPFFYRRDPTLLGRNFPM